MSFRESKKPYLGVNEMWTFQLSQVKVSTETGQHQGFIVQFKKVLPESGPVVQADGVRRVSDTKLSVRIPPGLDRGAEYKVRFYNKRTAYWGYFNLPIPEAEP